MHEERNVIVQGGKKKTQPLHSYIAVLFSHVIKKKETL